MAVSMVWGPFWGPYITCFYVGSISGAPDFWKPPYELQLFVEIGHPFKGVRARAPLKGFGVDTRQV